MKRVFLSICFSHFFLIVFSSSAEQTWNRVTTSDGKVADAAVELRGVAGDEDGQSLPSLEQQIPAMDVGLRTYLRFDLSSLLNQDVDVAYLTLESVVDYDARYHINVFGLQELDDGSDVPWSEGSGSETLTWASAPGGDSINTGKGNYLGRISVGQGGTKGRLVGSDIIRFLNADRDGIVTMALTLGASVDETLLFAGGENLLFSPPTLWIATTTKRQPAVAGVEGILSFPLKIEQEVERLDVWYSRVEVQACREGWFECRQEATRFYELMKKGSAQDLSSYSDRAAAVALTEMMRVEFGFRAKTLTDGDWAARIAEVLIRHPERAGDLISSFYILAGGRNSCKAGDPLPRFDFELILNSDIPPRAKTAAVQILGDRYLDNSEEGTLAHYRGLIPFAYGGPTPPYIVSRYADALRRTKGGKAVKLFLESIISRGLDGSLGGSTAVLSVGYEPDPAQKAALVSRFMKLKISKIADVLRPYYLTSHAQNGQLLEALTELDPDLAQTRSVNLGSWSDAVVKEIFRGTNASELGELALMVDSADLDLGELRKPFDLCYALAEQLYSENQYSEASAILLSLSKTQEIPLRGFSSSSFSTNDVISAAADTSANQQAIAALLLHTINQESAPDPPSRKYLTDASSLPTAGQTKSLVLFHQALFEVKAGRRAKAKLLLDEVLADSPQGTGFEGLSKVLIHALGE